MDKYFTIEKIGEITVINLLFAELSMEEAEEMKTALYGHVDEKNNKLLIDMSRCVFMSSVALGVLVSLTAKVHAVHGLVVLCSPTKEVAALLEITKLSSIYEIFSTRQEALSSFGKAGGR